MSPSTTARSSTVSLAFALLALASSARAETLDEVAGVERVCRSSTASALARAVRQRGEAAVTSASVLPNPELVLEHDRILTGADSHETTLGVGVPLGIGGRRSLLREAASARRAAARAEAETSLFEQAIAFREAYARAIVAQERVGVLDEQQRALEALTAVITGLAKAGEVAGFDLARQESQVSLHRRALDSARARAASSRRLLEVWLETPPALPAGALAGLGGGPELRTRARAPSSHARVRSLEATSRASSLEARAARRRAVPDVGVFLGYRTVTTGGAGSDTGHGFRLGLAVPLTFFDHGQGEAAPAEAESDVARATASQLRREHGAQASAAQSRLDVLERSHAELDKAVRQSEALRTKARQLYAAGELSISELLDAFRAVEETRLARIDLGEEIAEARLALMRARGTQFDARLDQACGRKP